MSPMEEGRSRSGEVPPTFDRSSGAEGSEGEPPPPAAARWWERPAWRGLLIFGAAVIVWVLLGLLFPSRFWRF